MLVLDVNILIRAVPGERRQVPVAPAIAALDLIADLVQTIESEVYARHEAVARQRIHERDEDDWPILAAALAFGCPIWTMDTDFFGCGVATWTTSQIEFYWAKAASRELRVL
jgi:predicted nucleic acid-binding protein